MTDLGMWLPVDIDPLRAKVVKQAMAMVGIVETPRGSNRSPLIDYMLTALSSPIAQPWCAATVCYILAQCGASIPAKDGAACETLHQWALSRGVFRSTGPIMGDVILYNFEGGPVAHHCGIVARITPDGMWAVEGNTTTIPNDREGDGVYFKPRYIPTGILGYFAPTPK